MNKSGDAVNIDNKSTLVIIPTYNEKDNIYNIIHAIWDLSMDIEILVVDDNSPDGTSSIVSELAISPQRKSNVHLLSRTQKMGLGTAYVAGFRWALQRDYDFIVQMDADLSHDPAYISIFLDKLSQYDFVIGSRYYNWKINVINWPLHRLLLSVLGQFYMRIIMSDLGLFDYTSGYKAFNRAVLADVLQDDIKSTGYCFQIEINFKAIKAGFSVTEVPIIFSDRLAGKSKISGNIIYEAFIQPILLRIRHILNNPNKF